VCLMSKTLELDLLRSNKQFSKRSRNSIFLIPESTKINQYFEFELTKLCNVRY
jgi:hypothetical protein